jgi:hypothetical protein
MRVILGTVRVARLDCPIAAIQTSTGRLETIRPNVGLPGADCQLPPTSGFRAVDVATTVDPIADIRDTSAMPRRGLQLGAATQGAREAT